MTAEGALPREATKRQAIEAQYRVLDSGRALEHAARYGEAAVVAEQVKREAERLGYVPLQAEALLLLGQVQARAGKPSEAEAALFDAIRRGFAGDERRLVIEAAIRLADFIAWGRNERFEEALRWLAIAEAGLDRLGERGELRARCLNTRGAVLASQLRYVDAIESHRRAVDIFERISPDSIDAAIAYNSLAFTAMAQGLHQEAFDALEKATRIYDARLGKEHDRTIGTRANTGTVLLWLGRADEALAMAEQAVKDIEARLGPDNPVVAEMLMKVAIVQREQGRCAKALEPARRALAIRERAFGAQSVKVASTLEELGLCALEEGRREEAIAIFERGLKIHEQTPGIGPERTVSKVAGLGLALAMTGRRKEGLEKLERAMKLAEGVQGLYGQATRGHVAWLHALAVGPEERTRALAIAEEAKRMLEPEPRYAVLARQIERWIEEQSRKASR